MKRNTNKIESIKTDIGNTTTKNTIKYNIQ